LASLGGSVVGVVIGTKLIPYIICNAYGIMYDLPKAKLSFHFLVCLGSILASLVCTLGATWWAVMATMHETPAALMRPRTPKAGKRIFLERIPFIWKRMNFSTKVSARNLLRYKKRFWMTVIGVGGCTALIITGLGLHTGIFAVIDRQYEELSYYNIQVGLDSDAAEGEIEQVLDFVQNDDRLSRSMTSYTNTVTFESDTRAVDGYTVSVADQADMDGLMVLREMGTKDPITIPDDGVVMSKKLSELLGISVGDTITIDDGGNRAQVRVAALCEHYVRHYVFMLDSYYAQCFGQMPEDNAIYARTAEDTEEAISDVAEDFMNMDAVISATNIRSSANSFEETMSSVNVVVVVIILAAAALAFVVLYNLTNINITERIRELATLKVLGFYDGETAMYVYRENFVLTLLGVALGQLLGKLLYTYLIRTVEVDLVMFGREAVWSSYVGSIVLSILFAILVNFVMYFRLKKIDMVESLKSVE
jgi:putative ABC transport system permease protein